MFAGVLASVVSLAGEPAGGLRLPLAVAAAVILFGHRLVGVREQSEAAPWVLLGPIGASTVLAILSAARRVPAL